MTNERLLKPLRAPGDFFKDNPDCTSEEDYLNYLNEEHAACTELKERQYRCGGTPLSRSEKTALCERMSQIKEYRKNVSRIEVAAAKNQRKKSAAERANARERSKVHQNFGLFGMFEKSLEYNMQLLPVKDTAQAAEPTGRKRKVTAQAAESTGRKRKVTAEALQDTAQAAEPTGRKRKATAEAVQDTAQAAKNETAIAQSNAVELAAQEQMDSDANQEWQDYRSKVKQLAESHNEVLAQRGRHLHVLASWYAADTAQAAVPISVQGVSLRDISERYQEGSVHIRRSALADLAEAPVHVNTTALAALSSVDIHGILHSLWPSCTAATLPNLLVHSIAGSLFADTASAAVDQEMEADTKLISIRVLADAVAFLGTGFLFSMEAAHDLGNSRNSSVKKGVARSDFAVFSASQGSVGRVGAAALVAEFAASAECYPVHKDLFVATAEAVYESHRLIAHLDKDWVHLARVHIVLVSDRQLRFGVVQPVYRQGGIFWILDKDGPAFDLSLKLDFNSRLVNALRMSRYLQEVVFPDAAAARAKLLNYANAETAALLPRLPTLIPPLREPGPLTPFNKRRKPM
ncbi:hypothetical protein HDU89_008979 [Geranomyces variabilis]|nr:hypothetical protein HDU89_008979 [Geranomyces variabilis]